MAHQSGMYSRCHNIFFMSSEIVNHNHFPKATKTSKSNQQIFGQKNNFYLLIKVDHLLLEIGFDLKNLLAKIRPRKFETTIPRVNDQPYYCKMTYD